MIHQVSKIHTEAIARALNIVPIVCRRPSQREATSDRRRSSHVGDEPEHLVSGDRVARMGIGFGLNAAVIDIEW